MSESLTQKALLADPINPVLNNHEIVFELARLEGLINAITEGLKVTVTEKPKVKGKK